MSCKRLSVITVFSPSLLLLLQACGGGTLQEGGGCAADEESATFSSEASSANVIVMNGVIDCTTEAKLNEALRGGPIDTIYMREVLGSVDDEANLAMSRALSARNMTLHVEDQGVIASGGVDFFLAGRTRTIGEASVVAVHSWEDSGGTQGIDLYHNDPASEAHQRYIEYYSQYVMELKDGRPSNDLSDASTDFYVYTLEAAPADGLHCMSAQELVDWGVVTEPTNPDQLHPSVLGDGLALSADFCTH